MLVNLKNTNDIATNTLIIGLPEHLNQLGEIIINDENINDQLKLLKQNQIVNTNIGTVSSTMFTIRDEYIKLITVGMGNIKTLTYNDYLKIFGNLFQYLKQNRITQASFKLETFETQALSSNVVAEVFGQQGDRAIYQFDNYKTDKPMPYELTLDIHTDNDDILKSIEAGQIIGSSINLARDYSNIPPNILTPEYYANTIYEHFKETEVEVDIKDHETLQNEGFGLIHAVGKGSKHGPRVITLTYNGGKTDEAPIALVGKGITYDSGGYSIKGKVGMQTMKFDMCGSANVVGIIEVARKLKLKINIVGVIAAAENMINEAAMKPDDVYTALSGESVEVLNTDAEGRLVLGDAVFYANQFQPQVILDFATLTGAAIVALGDDKAAVFNHNATNHLQTILNYAQTNDEFVFELPMTTTERNLIKNSDVADLVNHTNGQGKALFAATFINHFAGDTPHMHFDIAGPATINKNTYKGPKGPTGYLIPTIVEWLRNLK
ncbi:M17 family metallopeptidase [Staphylococcus pseudoxylosus]|uniref:Probable cytosol aminopeptidase n=1 Tax=Staphylococcus pseudoxylosus TaxID=2282419 RepID=A0AAQ0MH02_9STAP|nr:leucyl aminopeptidase family protein [Staphylococcus pseudoxylosus]PTI81850.1 aminopeptidase [Staphylococcus xylosus]MBM2658157.1 leucyl aminopeptidase family protein [Staphylococcus pseudoxylosus]MCE5001620.1 leucyl aminopeptidase family protein [Staphylococcus pseudoxylosus]MDW8546232.1 leucyl aminopeptidase family protein [Staphylococcus pseudoxylosus]MEB5784108.1 leucyl aminopeptidase family protein [Staphylococcus pseudoxylosus]